MLRLAQNGTTDSPTLREYELGSLPVGGRFRCGRLTGELVGMTPGRAIVELDGVIREQSFHTGEGDDVVFTSRRSRTTSFSLKTPVEFIGRVFYEDESDTDSSPNEEETMARKSAVSARKSEINDIVANVNDPANPDAENPVVEGAEPEAEDTAADAPTPGPKLVKKAEDEIDPNSAKSKATAILWKTALAKLEQLLKVDTASSVVDDQREKIRGLYDDAVRTGAVIVPPLFEDPVFEGMKYGAAHANPAPKEKTVAKKAKKTSATGAAKASRPAKSKELHPCHCGCDTPVAGNFKMGHDAKYRSMVLKVERGELKESQLPAYMKKHGGKEDAPLEFKALAKGGFKCQNSLLNH